MNKHSYNSLDYCVQRFKEFLDLNMLKKHGHKFPGLEHHADYICFKYMGKDFAVRFKILNERCKKAEAHLEVKANGDWKDLEYKVFDIKRSKQGRISNETYKPLFENFVIKGLKNYLTSDSK